MVARDPSSGRPEQGFFRRVFTVWRRFLARLASGGAEAAAGVASAVADDLEAARDQDSPALRSRTLFWAAWTTAIAGSSAAVAITPTSETLAAAVIGLAWAGPRLWLLRFAEPLPGDAAGVRGAWALGLCAYALAITPELGLAAFFVSGVTTGVTLVRIGAERRIATRAVLFAWGAQAAVMLCAWLARTAYVLLFLEG